MSATATNRRRPQPLAITGLGCIGAPGRGLDAQRAALAAGTCGLALAPDAGLPLATTVPVGRVTTALPPLPSRTAALALIATRDALTLAGLPSGHGDEADAATRAQ